MKKLMLAVLAAFLISFTPNTAWAMTLIDFNGLAAGTKVNTQFSGLGLTISAKNLNRSHDQAIIFDSNNPTGGDTDLGFGALDGGFDWSGGNIEHTALHKILIIAENINDFIINENQATGADGLVDKPDDEGGRPAGWIQFAWDVPLAAFGFDFVDVDGGQENPNDYKAVFFHQGNKIGERTFAQYAALDNTIVHGNNFANRYAPITSADLGSVFDTVKIKFAGSGAIDNVTYASAVPEPASLILFSTGPIGAYARRRFA